MANVPTISWDEVSPPGFQSKSLGAGRIREMKTQLRELIEVDHYIDDSGNESYWGQHKRTSFYPLTSNPIPPANTGMIYVKVVSSYPELFWIDEDLNYFQITSGINLIAGMVGEVRMYKGTLASIPSGWALCDGAGGRPNLINKFVKGVATAITEPGTSGGSNTTTLIEANLTAHTHSGTLAPGGGLHGTGHVITSSSSAGATSVIGLITPTGGSAGILSLIIGGGSHSHTTDDSGTGTALDIRPAYYECAFIIKT